TAPGTNSDKFQKIYDGPDLNIFENQNAVPRAAIVERVRVIGNGQDLIGELKKPEFNPRSQVFLEEDPDLKVSSIPLEASASIVDSSAETVQIRVNTNKDSVLVLADSYFPGWEAFVDQKPERIYRANYSFRAVVLKAGKHDVVFQYTPPEFRAGVVLMCFGLACWIAIALISVYQARSNRL